MSTRSAALADRLEEGARALAEFARGLTEEQWQLPVPGDGRGVGLVVHHVASMYPIEVQLAQQMARGEKVHGVTWDDVDAINAAHARQHDGVTRAEALALLERNAAEAAAAIRAMTDAQLDTAVPLSLNDGVMLTTQFMLEDHAVRHSAHHLTILRATVAGAYRPRRVRAMAA